MINENASLLYDAPCRTILHYSPQCLNCHSMVSSHALILAVMSTIPHPFLCQQDMMLDKF